MNRWIALLSSLPVLLGLGALVLWSLQSLDRAAPLTTAVEDTRPRYELRGVEWSRFDIQGQPELVVRADAMGWFDDQSASLVQPELHSFGGQGSPWRLTAPEGRLPAHSRTVELSGTVLATGKWPDGRELGFSTTRLWLDLSEKNLRTDADVSLEGAGRHVLATGLTADAAGQHLRLLSNVQAQYARR